MSQIARKIYHLRRLKGLTQHELAARVGLPQPNLSNIERGKQDMTVSTLERIAFALGVTPGSFFETEYPVKKEKWSRRRIEAVAGAISGKKDMPNEKDQKIKELFLLLLPSGARRNKKQVIDAWLELKSILSGEEIKQIGIRVRDRKQRSGKI